MARNFFATIDDLVEVSNWPCQVPNMRFFEEYSAPDQKNRWFEEPDEIAALLRNGTGALAAWPADVGGIPREEQVIFSQAMQDKSGATGRTILVSPATIRVQRVTDIADCLNPWELLYWTEKGARQRSIYDDEVLASVAWPKLASIGASIQRKIKKISPGKLQASPIMPDAYRKLAAGDLSLWNWCKKVDFSSTSITSTGGHSPRALT
jgi:hypothetical protein